MPVFPVSSVAQEAAQRAWRVQRDDRSGIVAGGDGQPDALIAVPMGRRTGVFAIDVDATPPHAHDGIGAWRALEAEHGAAPTRIHMTASGGLHLLYRWRAERPIGCPVKGLPKASNARAKAARSFSRRRSAAARPYIVVSDVEPATRRNWLLDILSPPKPKVEARPRHGCVAGRVGAMALGSAYGLRALDNACAKLGQCRAGRARSRRRRECARDWIARRRGRT